MRAVSMATCLWPGLARLWYQGEWRSLVWAVLFAAVVNFLLVTTFLWPHWVPGILSWIGWPCVVVVWSVSVIQALRSREELQRSVPRVDVGLFIQAQHEYLKGHWFEAEATLQRLLAQSHGDVPSLLLLATLYRRTKRFDEAAAQLLRLERLEHAYIWGCELEAERKLIARGQAATSLAPTESELDKANGARSQERRVRGTEATAIGGSTGGRNAVAGGTASVAQDVNLNMTRGEDRSGRQAGLGENTKVSETLAAEPDSAVRGTAKQGGRSARKSEEPEGTIKIHSMAGKESKVAADSPLQKVSATRRSGTKAGAKESQSTLVEGERRAARMTAGTAQESRTEAVEVVGSIGLSRDGAEPRVVDRSTIETATMTSATTVNSKGFENGEPLVSQAESPAVHPGSSTAGSRRRQPSRKRSVRGTSLGETNALPAVEHGGEATDLEHRQPETSTLDKLHATENDSAS